MAVNAGYLSVVRFRTTSGAGSGSDNVGVAKGGSFNRQRSELETTHLGDADREFILGLKGGEMSVDIDWDAADTGFARAETAFGDGSDLWVVVLRDGTNGWNFPAKVTALNYSLSRDEVSAGSVSLKLSGPVTTVP